MKNDEKLVFVGLFLSTKVLLAIGLIATVIFDLFGKDNNIYAIVVYLLAISVINYFEKKNKK